MNEKPKSRRGRPKTLDVDKTLDVAMHAYWRDDPVDVSINAICGMAGASKPAIYREFGSEDGLMRAVLDRYAEQVLSDIFHILSRKMSLQDTLEALIHFGAQDAKMATGCVFYKMRAGKHRLGPQTLQRINEIDAGAVQAFEAYLENCRETGQWQSDQPAATMARYLVEQIGLALTQRAAGENTAQVEQTMRLALSVFQR